MVYFLNIRTFEQMNSREKTFPIVSIITITFNNRSNLAKTITSVKSQDYKNIEYIIIDGGSNDGSVEIIKENESIISKWVSESDNGIYDAMNKGINFAKGDYVWFLNAGDVIHSPNTIKEIFSLSANADVYYGDTELVDDSGKSFGKRKLKTPPEKLSWKKMIDGMIITHQSLIIKRSLIPLYDLNYKFCADIDWTITVLQNSKNVFNTKMIISNFLMGGYSRANTIKSLKERYKILSKYFNPVYVFLNHIKLGFIFIGHIIRNRKILG